MFKILKKCLIVYVYKISKFKKQNFSFESFLPNNPH